MEYDDNGNAVVWKSVDNVFKTSESIKTLLDVSKHSSLPEEAFNQIQSALTQLSIFVRKESVALRRVVDPKKKDQKSE